jgi:hypothetical protein
VKAARLNFQPVAEPTLSIINNPGTNTSVQISIKLPDFQNFTLNLYTLSGKLMANKSYIDFPGALISVNELTETKGIFFVQLQTATTSQTKKIIIF